ncbi:unnamed protein product, partial [Polarella glacialis]
ELSSSLTSLGYGVDGGALQNLSWLPPASSAAAASLPSSIDFSAVEDSMQLLNLRPEDLRDFLA